MSRLFTAQASSLDIAATFGVDGEPIIPVPSELVEGDTGLIVVESQGRRLLKSARWGFPRHTREQRLRDEAPGIIGLVADLTNPMWDTLVVDPRYRCLIPLTHFANPAGEKGEKTRSWFSVKGEPIVAWAGFCRNVPDVGPVFAGMTMTANSAVEPWNDRMPVLLGDSEHSRWLHGSISDVIDMQFRSPISPSGIEVVHTQDRWRSGKLPDFALFSQSALL